MRNIVVLDTETTGDFGQPLIYDFAYKIVSPTGEVLKSTSSLVKEIFDCRFIMEKAYYADKYKNYVKRHENCEIDKKPFRTLIKEFIADVRKYKVDIVAAYNLAFDVRALNGTMKMCYSEGDDEQIFEKLINQKNKKLLCIWNLACETMLNTDEYREWATQNGQVSDKGNYLTSAESAYRYLINNPTFVEDHMALEDVDIEIDLLLHILDNYKGNLTYGLHYGSWQKVQRRG